MAGDWIKIEHITPDKPEVIRMADCLRIDQDSVVGKLLRVWIWADQNSISGNGVNVTDAFLDRLTLKKGFAAAMRSVGWLVGDGNALDFPGFDRHNGTTAKARAETNRRVAKHRARNADVTAKALHKPLPEKRREEIVQQQQHGRETDVVAGGIDPGPPLPAVIRLHPHCTQIEAEEWAQRHDRSTADGVRITPEIVVTWWEDRTRSDWQIAKHGTLIPLTTERAVETDLVSYARSWAKNEISRPQTHAQKRTAREIPSAVLTEPLPRL